MIQSATLTPAAPTSPSFSPAAGAFSASLLFNPLGDDTSAVYLERSLDNGSTFAPVILGAGPPIEPAIFNGPISLDINEARNGTLYRFRLSTSSPSGVSVASVLVQ